MSLSNPFFTLLVLLYADVCHVPNHIFLYLKIHRGAVFTQYLSSNNPVQLLVVCRPTLAKIYIIIIIRKLLVSSEIILYVDRNFSFSVQLGKFTEFF